MQRRLLQRLMGSAIAAAGFALFSSALTGAVAETPATAAASQSMELGPAIGEKIPHSLEIQSADGFVRDFDALKGENGMALYFVRSVDWCPFCQEQALDVSKNVKSFTERGLSVVFVSYDSAAKQIAFVQRNGFAPVILSDEGLDVINAFGVRNENAKEGSRWYGVPHPITFLLDTDGVIRAKYYEEDFLTNTKSYRNRPAVDLVLDGADKLLPAGS